MAEIGHKFFFNILLDFRARGASYGSPEGKILLIDTVSQNRLNTIKIMKFGVN